LAPHWVAARVKQSRTAAAVFACHMRCCLSGISAGLSHDSSVLSSQSQWPEPVSAAEGDGLR